MITLRQSIRPYVEQHLLIASQTGVPILQPMWYNFSDAECQTATVEDQYMFGPTYLVAPVLAPNVTSRAVYLPRLGASEVWTHHFTGQAYKGGQTVTVNVTLATFPLFVRGASSVKVQEEAQVKVSVASE